MLKKKIQSEIYFTDSNFKVKIGTLNKKNPNIIYLQLGTYIKPEINKVTYSEEINNFNKITKSFLNERLKMDNSYNKNFIMITDIADERINTNKNSYLDIQVHFKRNNKINETFKSISKELYNEHVIDFMNFIKEKLENMGFEYNKYKK